MGHPFPADASFDGGDLDCGNGLLLLIRQHIDPLEAGQLLEIRSAEASVGEDLPAWCRLTGNELVSVDERDGVASYLVSKGPFLLNRAHEAGSGFGPTPLSAAGLAGRAVPVRPLHPLPEPAPAPRIPPLAAGGIGSWPRPSWLLPILDRSLRGAEDDALFEAAADDAVRLAVAAQLRAGVGWVTDGEQRRDAYASFVGRRLDNCMLVPLTDLLPLVEDPDSFAEELRALDVPAQEVRHPIVFGPLGRSRPLAVHELAFLRGLTQAPAKIALPGPYLLVRTLWLECLAERAYASRDDLARDVCRVLREEVACLLAGGASLVQIDEPVLTEVVFAAGKPRRSFMCGALSERGDSAAELDFASALLAETLRSFPRERLALHVCRGNWTKDESALLAGDYRPLLSVLAQAPVGTLFIELSTPRAGELEVLHALPDDRRVGVGVLNPRLDAVESEDQIAHRLEGAVQLFGRDRVLANPDCGFATFAANPVSAPERAEAKLLALSRAAARVLALGKTS